MKTYIALLLVAFSLPVYSGWVTGNRLIKTLGGDENGYRNGYFDGYVNGVGDLSYNVLWCPPQGVKRGQLSKIVEKYLKSHPELLHMSGSELVVNSLKEPFPCKK